MNYSLTVDTNKIVTFQLGDDIYGIDIMAVREIIRLESMRELPDAPDYFYGIINLRGGIIPAINFKSIFGFKGFDFATDKDVIICKVNQNFFGLVIDKVIKVMDYDKNEIKPPPRLTDKIQSTFVTGVIKTENTLISLIDIYALFSQKGQNFLSYEKYKQQIFQTSLVEHFFTKKDKDNLDKLFTEIDFPFTDITRKPVLDFIVKTSVKKEVPIQKVIESIRTKNNVIVPEYLFHKNGNNIIFYHDKDFLTLQKLIKQVILPMKREKNENSLKFWVINKAESADAYSLLFILAILLEDEFDIEFRVIYSGQRLEDLNYAQEGIFKAEQVKRLTNSAKRYVFDFPELTSETKEGQKEKKIEEYKLKTEWQSGIKFDLFFNNSKFGKQNVDLIYAPYLFAGLSSEARVLNLNKFYDALNPGGILLNGFFETFDKIQHKFKGFMIGNRAYLKKE